jgi:putative acetyltransferase
MRDVRERGGDENDIGTVLCHDTTRSDFMISIRKETSGDSQEIRIVIQIAFGQTEEADLVERLRQSCRDRISLVAISEDRMVGQILFTPVEIQAKETMTTGMGLGPMAVSPGFQRQGIGSQWVRAGLTAYPRFGFVPGSCYGVSSEYENVPDEAFMILVLDQAALEGVLGAATYRPEFASAI